LIDVWWMNKYGVSGYVTKPIMQSELYNALVQIVSGESSKCVTEPSSEEGCFDRTIPRSQHAKARVLIAEDNLINQEVAREVLTRAGFVCDVVADGGAAVEAVQRNTYDLVLMDCQMPELDGFEATRLIREAEAREGGPRLPVLALTASALKGDKERCLEVGMTGYLSKPLDPSELIRSVDAMLSQASAPTTSSVLAGPDRRPTASTQLIDLADLTRRCMGNESLAARLQSEFQKQLTTDVGTLQRHAGESRADEVLRIAHMLKGAAASVACGRAREAAIRLEEAARRGDWSEAQSQIRDLEACSQQLAKA
jgi:CheY-like chemotaxis protein